MSTPAPADYTLHWLMFRLRPADLVQLLRLMAREDVSLRAEPLPPDTRVVDTIYDADDDLFTLVLESVSFVPVNARFENGTWTAAWNEMLFTLDDGVVERPVRPFPIPTEARWEAFLISPERLVELLRMLARGDHYRVPMLPPDVRLMDAFYDTGRKRMTIFLESQFFEIAKQKVDGDRTHLGLPERLLTVEITPDEERIEE